jgi:F-type H+-transporting ATPase subunit O
MFSSRAIVRVARSAASAPRAFAAPAIRTYAASAQDSKPPVALYGLDGTYAGALVRQLETRRMSGAGRIDPR